MRVFDIFMFTLIMISLASAGTYYPGQRLTFENKFDTTDNIDYEIIGNSTILPNLNMKVKEEEIKITLPSDMIPQTFHIIFVEQDMREVEVEKIVEEVVYRDKEVVTVEYENVTTNGLNATQYQNIIDMNETPKNIINTQSSENEAENKTKAYDVKWYIIVIGFFILIGYTTLIIILSRRKNSNN